MVSAVFQKRNQVVFGWSMSRGLAWIIHQTLQTRLRTNLKKQTVFRVNYQLVPLRGIKNAKCKIKNAQYT